MTADAATVLPPVRHRWPPSLTPWSRGVLRQRRDATLPELSADEWRAWQQAMDDHGLSPLVFKLLTDLPSSLRPPTPIMAVLQQAYLHQVALVAIRRRQLKRLLAALAELAQPLLVLKGAAVGETLYPDPALRPSADIDLLVRPEAYADARKFLLAAGYRSRKSRRSTQVDWAGEEEFVLPKEPNSFMVDLHWTLSPFTWAEQPQTMDRLFAKAQSADAGGQQIAVLATVDALVHAALHLVYANFDNIRLIWVYDIHLMAREIEAQRQWPAVFAAAVEWRGRLALTDALLLATDWFATPLPPGLTDPGYFPAEAAEIDVYRIVHSPIAAETKLQKLRLANLSPTQRLSYFWDRLIPAGQEIDLNYPRFQKWPYPLKVIGRLSTILFDRSHGS